MTDNLYEQLHLSIPTPTDKNPTLLTSQPGWVTLWSFVVGSLVDVDPSTLIVHEVWARLAIPTIKRCVYDHGCLPKAVVFDLLDACTYKGESVIERLYHPQEREWKFLTLTTWQTNLMSLLLRNLP